jgi:exosortase
MGALFFIAGSLRVANLNENDHLSLLISSGLTIYMGIFILFYGPQAFKRAMFPLLLLVCMAPVPSFIVRTFEQLLQSGSAETVGAIFWLLGLEVNRSGYAFHFPHLTVEIWESCTGIRASIALVITSVIAANLFLSKGWTKVLAVILSIPISILKNSFRIVIISIIGAYVDESVFDSALHSTEGGAFFFIGALLLVWLVIIALGRIEKWKTKPWSMFSAVR